MLLHFLTIRTPNLTLHMLLKFVASPYILSYILWNIYAIFYLGMVFIVWFLSLMNHKKSFYYYNDKRHSKQIFTHKLDIFLSLSANQILMVIFNMNTWIVVISTMTRLNWTVRYCTKLIYRVFINFNGLILN